MTILSCGHNESKHSEFTTGYGIDSKGKTYCYQCCAEMDKKSLRNDKKHYGYMTQAENGNWYYTNWPGSLKFRIAHWEGKHNWHNVKQHYGNFFFEGNWYIAKMVTGGYSECASAHKVKAYPFYNHYAGYEKQFGEVNNE